ncbi:hypothetical protein CC78DRAFT_582281 [Lojkania enalia]|uniref:Uncharacterized protein n=1 Tax=Lojkania enalia TaxID=147567 RepID=A0A9P4MYM1_9PLEO|nr:hypothetical protein CC78DRAFT_582281 [Didymosphaeria enalia]
MTEKYSDLKSETIPTFDEVETVAVGKPGRTFSPVPTESFAQTGTSDESMCFLETTKAPTDPSSNAVHQVPVIIVVRGESCLREGDEELNCLIEGGQQAIFMYIRKGVSVDIQRDLILCDGIRYNLQPNNLLFARTRLEVKELAARKAINTGFRQTTTHSGCDHSYKSNERAMQTITSKPIVTYRPEDCSTKEETVRRLVEAASKHIEAAKSTSTATFSRSGHPTCDSLRSYELTSRTEKGPKYQVSDRFTSETPWPAILLEELPSSQPSETRPPKPEPMPQPHRLLRVSSLIPKHPVEAPKLMGEQPFPSATPRARTLTPKAHNDDFENIGFEEVDQLE